MVSVSSPSLSGVKIEKSLAGTVKVGTASSITIGRPQNTSNMRILSPTNSASTSSGSNMKVVRVVNSSGGGSPQKVIQVQKQIIQQPRILNQTWNTTEVKSEPASSRSVTIVRKSEGSNAEEPPTKKTKYITLTTSQINQIEGATILGGGKTKRIVMLPSNYREQLEKISISPQASTSSSGQTFKIVQQVRKSIGDDDHEDRDDDPLCEIKPFTGKKSKRPCNCTKSQCLKFYCDCFAAGEYCNGCNCKDCFNEHDSEEREKSIKLCMERNPFAFR